FENGVDAMSTAQSPDPQKPLPAEPKPAAQPPPPATVGKDAATADIAAVLGEERELWRGRMSWKHFASHWVVWGVIVILLLWVWRHFCNPTSESEWLGWTVFVLVFGSGLGLLARSALVVYGKRY